MCSGTRAALVEGMTNTMIVALLSAVVISTVADASAALLRRFDARRSAPNGVG